ncbi:MAG: EAL domain-containing protein [Hyphomicrobiaceae bacterium]|nr:EAL domain-containing protein [Hyphomicrobiaceae bacterium]
MPAIPHGDRLTTAYKGSSISRELGAFLLLGVTAILASGLVFVTQSASGWIAITLGVLALGIEALLTATYLLHRSGRNVSADPVLSGVIGAPFGLALGALGFNFVQLVEATPGPNASLFAWFVLLAIVVLLRAENRVHIVAVLAPAIAGVGIGLLTSQNHAFAASVAIAITIAAAIITFVARQMRRLRFEREQAEIMSALSSILLQESAEGPQNWAWRTDFRGRMIEVSPGFTRATGISRDLWMGIDFKTFLTQLPSASTAHLEQIMRNFDAQEPFQNIDLELDDGGRRLHWRMSGSPIRNTFGNLVGWVGANFDLTSAKEIEREIYELAHFDQLTGLINRNQFNFQLDHLVSRLERYGSPFVLMLIDLDHFKSVNDNRGHLVGDQVLAQVSERIKSCVRDSDFAARLGGDEFAVILSSISRREDVEPIARRLSELMSLPFVVDGEELFLGASIGIAIAPLAGTRPNQLMRNADLALYRAKADGRGTWRFFVAAMDAEEREKRLLENELRMAIEHGELELYFQPLIDSTTRRATSFEALLRWNHPLRGLVSPAEFIPVAEESGAIVEIGNWTIDEAIRAAKTWPEPLRVAVNLSPRHFADADIIGITRAALERHHLDPGRLELEITEGVLVSSDVSVIERLTALKKLGVTIAMDDFGTGYSSLSYLLKFPFDTIKIDKSFVEKLPNDNAAQRILQAIVALGHSLSLSITAEGVETPEQAAFLNSIACQKLQGYHFAKPLRETELAAYLLKSGLADLRPGDANVLELPRKSAG